MFSLEEANDRLRVISEYIQGVLEGSDPILLGTFKHLELLKRISLGTEDTPSVLEKMSIPAENKELIILSCDGSFREATDTLSLKAAAAYTIEIPNSFENGMEPAGKIVKAHDLEEAELIAIYMALSTLVNLHNRPEYSIQVRSDSRNCVDALNHRSIFKTNQLQEKVRTILDFTAQIPARVDFVWYPRQSTKSLALANSWAQNLTKHREK